MQKVLVVIVKIYQYFLSPWLGNQCRFTPSCSHYAIEAIERHGSVKGALLSLKRICCCHPWHEGGVDPVPPRTVSTPELNPTSSKFHG